MDTILATKQTTEENSLELFELYMKHIEEYITICSTESNLKVKEERWEERLIRS